MKIVADWQACWKKETAGSRIKLCYMVQGQNKHGEKNSRGGRTAGVNAKGESTQG